MTHRTARRPLVGNRPTVGVVSLVGLVAFVALAIGARTLPAPGLVGDAPSRIGHVATDHPDVVGLAEARPSVGAAHLLALPTSFAWLVVALLATAAALALGGSAAPQARWRRWRARLEGAPPLVT